MKKIQIFLLQGEKMDNYYTMIIDRINKNK